MFYFCTIFYYNRGWKRFEITFFITTAEIGKSIRWNQLSRWKKFLLVNKTSFDGFSVWEKETSNWKASACLKSKRGGGCKEARLLRRKLCCFSYDFCFHPTGSPLEHKHLVLIKKSRVVHAAKNNFLIFSSSLLMGEDLQGVKLISSPSDIHVV